MSAVLACWLLSAENVCASLRDPLLLAESGFRVLVMTKNRAADFELRLPMSAGQSFVGALKQSFGAESSLKERRGPTVKVAYGSDVGQLRPFYHSAPIEMGPIRSGSGGGRWPIPRKRPVAVGRRMPLASY